MKSKQIVTILISVIIGFSIGLMSGLTLTNPGMSLAEAAGSIGRVDQYRNVRITQEDIELRNELLEDETRREAFLGYLAYEYARNVRMGENVRLAIRNGDAAGDFRSANSKTMERLHEYDEFLDNARMRILEAIGTLHDLDERDKVAVHAVLKDAGNALAQNALRDGVLFDFMTGVEHFFQTASPDAFPGLASAHDHVFASLLSDNIVKGNRPTLEHLLAKRLIGDEGQLGIWDAAQLQAQLLADVEQLGYMVDAEQLGFWASEQLGRLPLLNAEQLGAFTDADQLGFYDAERLQGSWDSEKLGFNDAEQLGLLFDAEQMGAYSDAADQLQGIFY
jgi:hypothetical protein